MFGYCGSRSSRAPRVLCEMQRTRARTSGSFSAYGCKNATRRIRSGLLRPRRERPRGRRSAEQREERAPFHSITSSASCWRCSGTSRPSALAVCRLMTNSNLVDCTTGTLAGFAPFRIRPVYTPT
jgi:hypothetical protein